MVKKLFLVGIIILILFYVIYFLQFEFGPGTYLYFEVVEGCGVINANRINDTSFTVDDKALDSVKLKYGYSTHGLRETSLRECLNTKYAELCMTASLARCLYKNQ